MNKFLLFLAAIGLAVNTSFSGMPRTSQSAGNGATSSDSLFQTHGNSTEVRIAVTPWGFDDVGWILRSMGWTYTDIQLDDLSNPNTLAQYDVLFINCIDYLEEYSTSAAAVLEQFVREGGTLYASDWAYVFIENSFPGYVDFFDDPKSGQKQTITADIVDPGLASYLNSPNIAIQFPLDNWVPVQAVSDAVKVYLAGDFTLMDGTVLENKSLAVSFPYGEGRVVYTAYHNEGQNASEEIKLLEYLVFITFTEDLSASLQESMTSAGYVTQQEILGSVSAGEISPQYSIPNTSISALALGLNWQEGTLRLSVFKPDGSFFDEQEGSPPLLVEIPNAEAGDWSFQVTGVDVPSDNMAYVVQVGAAGVGAVAPPASGSNRNPPLLYLGIGIGLCLCSLLLVALIIGGVVLLKRRRA